VSEIERLRHEVNGLRHEVQALRRRVTFFDHWHNTVHSAWWKRVWWWCLGFRLSSLGTWYRARWNESARKYD